MELKNGMILKLEKVVKSDAQQILDYLNIVGGESDNLLFGANEFKMSLEEEENFIKSIGQSALSSLRVGKIGEEIVCLGSVMAYSKERIAHQSELAVSVKKKYWGLGVGRCLLETLIEDAKRNDKTEILHLGVKSDNNAAIELYKKMGFEESGRHEKFFKVAGTYYDEILMDLHF